MVASIPPYPTSNAGTGPLSALSLTQVITEQLNVCRLDVDRRGGARKDRGGIDMAVTVKKTTLWRKEVPHRSGVLADVLEPLASAGADLRIVMGYTFPTGSGQAAVEVFPVSGRKVADAAARAGLAASSIACLLVEGDDRPGLGARMARGIADAGVNISFVMAQTVGRKFSAVFGFERDADAKTAAGAIKRSTRAARR
jgi:hypothetical protein